MVRALLDAPNHVHLSTLRTDGSPRNWVVWVGLEGPQILICTSDQVWKAKDMRRDPRVGISVVDRANPYDMASIEGRVVEIRPDEGCRYMDPIAVKYTGAPFPSRGPDRVCFVIAVVRAWRRTLGFQDRPRSPPPILPGDREIKPDGTMRVGLAVRPQLARLELCSSAVPVRLLLVRGRRPGSP